MWLLRLKNYVKKIIDKTASILIVIFLILWVLFISFFYLLTITYLTSLYTQGTDGFVIKVTRFVLKIFFDIESLTRGQYTSLLAVLQNTTLTVVAISLAVLPVLGYYQITKRRNFRVHPITQKGVDDIKIMSKYYNGAEKLTIFSGDFSWIKEDEKMQSFLKKLAGQEGKLRLLSYKGIKSVGYALGPDLYDSFKSVLEDTGAKVKCSLVEYQGGSSVFLYKYRSSEVSESSEKMCIISDYKENRYLLGTLKTLIEKI